MRLLIFVVFLFSLQSNIYSQNISAPIVTGVSSYSIQGTADPTVLLVKVFYADNTFVCQGGELIGSAIVSSEGTWTYNFSNAAKLGDVFTAQAILNGQTSSFGNCWTMLPEDCDIALDLPVQIEPCATSGALLDLSLTSFSNFVISSICTPPANSNDVWLKTTIPSSGNLLLRTSLYNTIDPVVQIFEGTCGNLQLYGDMPCQTLDSVRYSIFINDTPGKTIYIQAWDDTPSYNSIFHFTAHELPTNKDEWSICDIHEDSRENPSLITSKDATSLIITYEPGTTQAEIDQIRSELDVDEGTIQTCGCEELQMELWVYDTPVEMEDNIRGANQRGNVDGANYNYHLEDIEFQINIYTSGDQHQPSLAMNDTGDFAISWTDEGRKHAYFRSYSSSGNPLTQEIQIGDPTRVQNRTSISYLKSGNIAAVWEDSESINSSQFTIKARLFNNVGEAVSPIFDISELTNQPLGFRPEVMPSSVWNNFFVSWVIGNELYQVEINGFNGNNIGNPIILSNPEINFETNSSFYVNANDFAVITYEAIINQQQVIFAQRIANGNLLGSPIMIPNVSESHSQADLYVNSDNSFNIIFKAVEGNNVKIKLAQFSNTGNLNFIKVINKTEFEDANDPSISGFNNGDIFMVWSGNINNETRIYGHHFTSDGQRSIVEEIEISNLQEFEKTNPKVATDKNSFIISSWEDGGNDGSGKGIFGQRFEIIDSTEFLIDRIGQTTPFSLLGDRIDLNYNNVVPEDSLGSVRVSVIDTGVDPTNTAFSQVLWEKQSNNVDPNCYSDHLNGYNAIGDASGPFDNQCDNQNVCGHGTSINGIISSDFPGSIQLELMNQKVKSQIKGNLFHTICAIFYAIDHDADIINLSLGFEAREVPKVLQKAIDKAAEHDILIITSAGNTSKNNDNIGKYPANLSNKNLLTVTSFIEKGFTQIADFASYGQLNVDIAAPGYILAPHLDNNYIAKVGTSFSTAIVTRTAAIMRALYPSLSAIDIRDCIMASSTTKSDFSNKINSNGILNHEAALSCAEAKSELCKADTVEFLKHNHIANTIIRSNLSIHSSAMVKSNVNVSYLASKEIELFPGFATEAMSNFLIDFETCEHEVLSNTSLNNDSRYPWYSQNCVIELTSPVNISIPIATVNFWDAAIKQENVKLKQNRSYKFSVTAKADENNRIVQSKIGKVEDNSSYFNPTFIFDTSMSTQEYTFQMLEDDPCARIELFFGSSEVNVTVENISLVELK